MRSNFDEFFHLQNIEEIRPLVLFQLRHHFFAYFLSQNKYPLERQVHQGDQMGRPNRLTLKLDEQQTIYVGGQIIEVGEGVFKLP